jgi:hypothetical protein
MFVHDHHMEAEIAAGFPGALENHGRCFSEEAFKGRRQHHLDNLHPNLQQLCLSLSRVHVKSTTVCQARLVEESVPIYMLHLVGNSLQL